MPITLSPNQNVPYAGKLVPQDAAPDFVPVVMQNVPYEGSQIPPSPAKPQIRPTVDAMNDPSVCEIYDITQTRLLVTLPPDVRIMMPAKKRIVKSTILDGVIVYERILREPTAVNFEFTLRMVSVNGIAYNGTQPPSGATGVNTYIFPQAYLNTVYKSVFLPNTVLIIVNTQLNGVGIQHIIVEEFDQTPVRGGTDVKCTLKCWENVAGNSLNMAGPTNTNPNSLLGIVG